MKKFYIAAALIFAAAASFLYFGPTISAQVNAPTASTTLVLSQVSGGNATYTNDWVEIKNISSSAQSLNGLALYYGSATGVFGAGSFSLPNVSIAPGQYYLVQLNNGGGSSALPVTPDASTINISMSGSSGKIGLVNQSALAPSVCGSAATPCSAAQLAAFVDWVAYGQAGNGTAGNGEGGTSVNNNVALTSSQGSVRKNFGCADTDNNNADFDVVTTPVPRNSASTISPCQGGSGVLQGAGAANPTSAAPGGLTLLTVTVSPAANPASTGISVNADLSSIGGSANQQLFDDGTNGDAAIGDNTFSYFATIPGGTSGGLRSFPISIADAQARTATASINFTVTGQPDPSENILLGNPSNAVTDVNQPDNYLLVKTQYVMSYNRDRGIPNWVGWHLDSSWIGSANRQNDFRPDPSLPAGWYQVLDSDYSGSGFDRGHHCPSGDRTDTTSDNSATFFMTNMMPQAPNNNQGVWADLEVYCRTLASQGNELYIYAGGYGVGGTGSNGGVTNTIANGHVTVPALTWKVILVIPNGSNDLYRIGKTTRTIAVIMPNSQSVGTPGTGNWRNYRVPIRKVEALTGYNFFSNVRPMVRSILKLRTDTQ